MLALPQPFSQGAPVPFAGEEDLEARIWVFILMALADGGASLREYHAGLELEATRLQKQLVDACVEKGVTVFLGT